MSVTIIHKKGSGIPSADSLEVAEIAVDVVTGKLYTKTQDGEVVEISGGGDGDGIPAEFDPEFTYYEPWKGEEVGGGPTWVVEDGLSAPFIHTAKNLSAKKAEFGEVKATTVDTHAPFYGSVSSAFGTFTEATILGGINIPAVNEDRPGDLPFDLSDEEAKALKDKTRSIQYALTVTHETLGRTVEIDKEGIIRANQFTDMDGNPIGGGGGDPEWAIVNSSGTEFRLGYSIDRGDTSNVFVGHGISVRTGSNNVAIGKSATIEGSSNVVIGQNITTNMASDSVAIGRNSQIRDESVAIGYGAKNTGDNSIAIGYNAIASRNQFAVSPEIATVKVLNAQVQAKSVDASTTVKAADFLDADGNSIVISELDDIPNVNATNPSRDDLLVWNGSAWQANDFGFLSALHFKGAIDVAEPAPAAVVGDLYVNDTEGPASASWTGISGRTVKVGNFIGYANGRWYLLGDMADIGVTSVLGGEGISVDDSKPSEPVVYIDKDKLDEWYVAKSLLGTGRTAGDVLRWDGTKWKESSTINIGTRGEVKFVDSQSAFKFENAGTGGPSLWITDDSERVTGPFFIRAQSFAVKDQANRDMMALDYQGNLKANSFEGDGSKLSNISYTESDPTVGQHIKSITVNQIQEWNESYKWGNHALQNYLKSETDPVFKASPAGGIKQSDIDKWNNPPAGGKTYSSANGVTVNNTDNTIKMSGSYNGRFAVTQNWDLVTGNPTILAKGQNGGGIGMENGSLQSGFYADSSAVLRVFVGKPNGMPASQAAKFSFNTSGTFTANKVEGQGFEAKKGTSVANFFKSTNDLGTSVGGSVGRELEVQILDGARRMYFQDWASCLYIAGSFSGPEMHSNLQATCQINSQGLQATPKGNVKSLRKVSTGAVQATYNTDANVFVGSPPVPVACTNEGDSLAKGFCTAKGDGGSWSTFTVRRYSTSGAAVEGSAQCIVGHPITETLKNTRDIDLAFETEKAEKLQAMMEHANNTEWYDADGEGLSGSEVVWVSPTDSGVVVQRSLTASEDSQDHYPDTTRILHNDLPKEEWLFDAWKLDGKKVIVDLDKAKADALATLKNQARFYLPRVSCLAGIFDEDDDMQKLKDLILGFKSKISDRSVTVTQINEIMGQIRQEGLGCFAFREY